MGLVNEVVPRGQALAGPSSSPGPSPIFPRLLSATTAGRSTRGSDCRWRKGCAWRPGSAGDDGQRRGGGGARAFQDGKGRGGSFE